MEVSGLSQVGILTPCPSLETAKEGKPPARLCLLDQGECPGEEGGSLTRAPSLGGESHRAAREAAGLKCLQSCGHTFRLECGGARAQGLRGMKALF